MTETPTTPDPAGTPTAVMQPTSEPTPARCAVQVDGPGGRPGVQPPVFAGSATTAGPRIIDVVVRATPTPRTTVLGDSVARAILTPSTVASIRAVGRQVNEIAAINTNFLANLNALMPPPSTLATINAVGRQLNQFAAVHLTPTVTFFRNTISPLVQGWSNLLFERVHEWVDLAHSGAAWAKYLARRALADLERARRAALDGDFEEIDWFVHAYFGREMKSYLTELRKIEGGADRRHDYSQDEARSAIVTALLDPLLATAPDGDVDAFAVIGDGLRRQLREFQPVWTRKHGGQTLLLLEVQDRAEGSWTMPETPPGEYGDARLDRAYAMFDPREWAVLIAYTDGYGSATWAEAAVAAGQPPEFGERVRRKRVRVCGEANRRLAAPVGASRSPSRYVTDAAGSLAASR